MNEYDDALTRASVAIAERDELVVKLAAAQKTGIELLAALRVVGAERDLARYQLAKLTR